MSENNKSLDEKVEELELVRLLDILRFKKIDDWIDEMEKRWAKRVTKRDLISLYKWIKDIYAQLDEFKTRIEKLESPDSE